MFSGKAYKCVFMKSVYFCGKAYIFYVPFPKTCKHQCLWERRTCFWERHKCVDVQERCTLCCPIKYVFGKGVQMCLCEECIFFGKGIHLFMRLSQRHANTSVFGKGTQVFGRGISVYMFRKGVHCAAVL